MLLRIFELGMGARPLAMGGAFVGLADDGNALFYNAAGLAWAQGLSVLSSYEARPGTASYGTISASLPHFGFSIHYFTSAMFLKPMSSAMSLGPSAIATMPSSLQQG